MIRRHLLHRSGDLHTIGVPGRAVGRQRAERGPRRNSFPCPRWGESSSGPTSFSSTSGASSATCLPATAACWTATISATPRARYDECQAALEQIKRERTLAANEGQGRGRAARAGPQRARRWTRSAEYLREEGRLPGLQRRVSRARSRTSASTPDRCGTSSITSTASRRSISSAIAWATS